MSPEVNPFPPLGGEWFEDSDSICHFGKHVASAVLQIRDLTSDLSMTSYLNVNILIYETGMQLGTLVCLVHRHMCAYI